MASDPLYEIDELVYAKVGHDISESTAVDLLCKVIEREWEGNRGWVYKVILTDSFLGGDIAAFGITILEDDLRKADDE